MTTARLENWTKYIIGNSYVYTGLIYEDKKGRWPDGTMITTSRVKGVTNTNEGSTILNTLNSSYLLGKPNEAI